MKILVTGVAGFIGSNLVCHLKNNSGLHITGIDLFHGAGSEVHVDDYIEADLADMAEIRNCCKEVEYVIHLAGDPASYSVNTEQFRKSLRASVNIIDCAIKSGVKKFILISSNKADGTLYADNKAQIEDYLKVHCAGSDMEFTILKCATVFGPGMKSGISRFITRMINGANWKLPATPAEIMMIGVNDLCASIIGCMQFALTRNKTYVLSDCRTYRIDEIGKIAGELSGTQGYKITVPKWVFKIAAEIGDLVQGTGITPPFNNIGYNLLFANRNNSDPTFWEDTGLVPKQNFYLEMKTIFKEASA